METNKLKEIKDLIEKMSHCYQLDILGILNEDPDVLLSENSNGVFINLSNLNESIIKKLEKYIKYIEDQKYQLLNIENEKSIIKKSFFSADKKNIRDKRIKDNTTNKNSGNNIVNAE